MYCTTNFPTKKALKEAIKQRLRWLDLQPSKGNVGALGLTVGTVVLHKEFPNGEPDRITFFQHNNMFGIKPTNNGVETIEGPHNPKPHTWYARCTVVDGEVVKIT